MSNPRISIAQLKQLIQFESSELTMREIGRALSLSAGATAVPEQLDLPEHANVRGPKYYH